MIDASAMLPTENRDVEHDDRVALRCAKGEITVMALVNRCASVQVEEFFAEDGGHYTSRRDGMHFEVARV